MKCRCQDCINYFEGNDGEYGSGPFYMECGNPYISDSKNRRINIEELPGFPFYPAPGCFFPDPMKLDDSFFPEKFNWDKHDFFEWLNSAQEWSGDAIDLVDGPR